MGVDQIVALGHSGFAVDQEVARRVGGVDVVIGGHSNTFLYTGGRGLLLFSLLFLLLGGLQSAVIGRHRNSQTLC